VETRGGCGSGGRRGRVATVSSASAVPGKKKGGVTVGEETYDRRARVAEREGEKGEGVFSGWVAGLVSTPGRPRLPFFFFFSPSFFYIFLISVLFI
jgi:hypothetical protein